MFSHLTTSIQYLKGIGPKRAKSFEKSGIKTIEDLLFYFPRCYEDRSEVIPLDKVIPGNVVTVEGEVFRVGGRRAMRRGMDVLEVVLGDDTKQVTAVWFNQPYLRHYFLLGKKVLLHGKAEIYKERLQIVSPEFEMIDEGEEFQEVDKIVPRYTLPQGYSQRGFRKIVKIVLDKHIPQVEEVLPFNIRSKHRLLNIAQSLLNIHFPQSHDLRKEAFRRLSFEEFFIYQVPLVLRKLKRKEKAGIAFKIEDAFLDAFIRTLAFELTFSQKMVLTEIKHDMSLSKPMQRLLQGDVGSGKTIVATLASLVAVSNGFQVAFMVPTEILANQHFEKLSEFFKMLSHKVTPHSFATGQAMSKGHKSKIELALLTGSITKEKRKKIYKEIATGEIDIVIGTHAVIQEGVNFKNLGLIVIDEQHKFGVSQRTLLTKKGISPDILIMTATPIPRTLAMTLYGDLDISLIRELPPGRKKIETLLYNLSERSGAYDFVKKQVLEGRQVYIVYPIIEESETLELSSAKKMFKEFSEEIFKEFKVGLLHGRVKKEEQELTMRLFRDGKLDILVATTILEVGIDVPNATVMMIEHADRFGLSQLHQMRGRVGRGAHASFCLLVSDAETEEAQARLGAFVKETDGFKIAEEDLKLRGPGEFFGDRQHGLVQLKIANPLTQMHLLKAAREEAIKLIETDPKLLDRNHQELRRQLYMRFPEFEKFLEVA
jgi:ATP-dependent DNA helicase RecG